jgi:hypothetical protein
MVGSEGSMTVEWDKVTLFRNRDNVDANDPLTQTKNNNMAGKEYVYDRKSMLSPDRTEYNADKGYKGAHFDHHYNMYNAMRNNGKVVEDALFSFRAAAPALLCNDSYFKNKIVQWDPVNLTVKNT